MAKNRKTFNMIPEGVINPVFTEEKSATDKEVVTEASNNTSTTPIQRSVEPVEPVRPVQMQQTVKPITAGQDALKKRVYVNISMDHYKFAKKKTGSSIGTLQDYFDALIEYDKTHNVIVFDEE